MVSRYRRRGGICAIALAFALASGVVATAAAEARRAADPPAPPAAPELGSTLGAFAPIADRPYPGLITLNVDAADLDHHVLHVVESVPVEGPGELVFLYPKWLPGNHAPSGPINALSGLSFRAGGRTLAWSRDPVEVYAFHVTAPEGVSTIDASFDVLTPLDPRAGRVVMTPSLIDLQWTMALLYPAGYPSRRLQITPRLVLPQGWTFATALDIQTAQPDGVSFRPVDLETLADSPVLAGVHASQVDLDPGGAAPVRLNIFSDNADALAMRPDQLAAHRNLVRETYRLFGARRFDRYDFLLGLSYQLSGVGLEHGRSSENVVGLRYFADWEKLSTDRQLLPHEFVHSWNGKFKRPRDLYGATFDTPMRDSLLWVYEGLTQYYGYVLAARSGMVSRQLTLEVLAAEAAAADNTAGRRWRSLQDTTAEPILADRGAKGWPNWQRTVDYYHEGALLWLDIDTLIREQTRGQRSLDDFARSFFGGAPGDMSVRTYVFEDVVKALNAVAPNDWASYLRNRLDRTGAQASAPLEGVARGGYRLVYSETPTDLFRLDEARRKVCDLSYSIGLNIDASGVIRETIWDSTGYRAGLAPGAMILAVGGQAYDAEGLKDAVRAAKSGTAPIELIVRTGDQFRIIHLDYHEGLRYPRLERDPAAPARLDDILAARVRRGEGG